MNHEIDGAADAWRGTVIVESKALSGGISKGDLAVFHYKVTDFYQKRIATASSEKSWPILCSATATQMSARAAAVSLGVLVSDPARAPLPILVRAAGKLAADMHLPESLAPRPTISRPHRPLTNHEIAAPSSLARANTTPYLERAGGLE